MNLTDIDTSDLTDDGDTLELSDRFRLRLKIEADMDASINDYDSDGKVEWSRNNPNTGDPVRPEGFDGGAIILRRDHGYCRWWQPYGDTIGYQVGDEWHFAKWAQLPREERSKMEARIRDLDEYGFKEVGLQLDELVTDSFGHQHWVEVGSHWIGGVDEFYPEIVRELAEELPDIELEVE